MTTNSPNYDAALTLATTVGRNFKTLRDNKRKLAYNLVMAVAVEGFGWTDAWAATKKSAGFAKLEKPEQNQLNVFGTACKTIILAWPTLADDVKAAFTKGELVFSTLATSIKDAEKAADKAEAEAIATVEAGEAASLKADADHGKPAPTIAFIPTDMTRVDMIEAVAAMFDVDADAATMTPEEIRAMLNLIGKVEAFKAAIVAKSQAA